MNSGSSRSFAGPVFFFFLVTGLVVCGCDGTGSDSDGAPGWVGEWKVVDVSPDSLNPPGDVYYSITTDSIETVARYFEDQEQCDTGTSEITSVDGNVITIEDEYGRQETARIEASNNILTITLLESTSDLERVTAEPAGSAPRQALNCTGASAHRDDARLFPDS